jgi:hypothetical protein
MLLFRKKPETCADLFLELYFNHQKHIRNSPIIDQFENIQGFSRFSGNPVDRLIPKSTATKNFNSSQSRVTVVTNFQNIIKNGIFKIFRQPCNILEKIKKLKHMFDYF